MSIDELRQKAKMLKRKMNKDRKIALSNYYKYRNFKDLEK